MSPVLPERIFAGVPPESANWEHARVVILPVPYDSTVSSKVGAREGPRAIIDASLDLEWYDPELDRETYQVGIHTMPELEPVMSGPKGMLHAIAQAARQVVAQGKLLVTLGGEHTITAGAVEAVAERFPGLTVLQIDAHADLRDRYQGTRYNHACVMRRVIERCPIVNVGLRSLSLEESRFIREHSIPVFPLPETRLDQETVQRIVAHLSSEVYVSIDLDGLDPA
ncbi:MAG: agmatinase, partial [Chloroflexi bacterium]|nr:agmatinase [Chloroflexota bacterium]